MRPMILLALLSGCVLDRTGTSATSGLEREMALRDARVAELERIDDESQRRIHQLEEVVRYRGQQEAEKLENLDQVRQVVGSLQGDLDVLRHELKSGDDFREDVDFRLTWLELRVEALEDSLGLKAPPPPEREEDADTDEDGEDADGEDGEDKDRPETPDALMKLAKEHLAADRPRAARAVLERLLEAHEGSDLAGEATYRLAETYFNDGSYQQAILRFQDVVDGFGGTGWAAWSMVRQGECFKKLEKVSEAQLFWEDVMARYPNSPAATEAGKLLGR